VSIKFVEKEERQGKGGYVYRAEPKTRSTRNTGKKTGREESVHTRHRLIETGKKTNTQGRCVRETEAIIGKAPRLGIHTSEEPTQRLGWCGPDSKRNMRGQHQFHIKDVIIVSGYHN